MDSILNRTLRTIYRTPIPEVTVFAVGGLLVAQVSLAYSHPAGYAGLYSLMSELVLENNFSLPAGIPYYNGAALPFAYPPLGPYLEAALIRLTNLSTLEYARIFPAIVGLLTLVAAYWFYQKATGDRSKALVATFLFSSAQIFLVYHVQAAGIVRGPALLWSFLVLGIFWQLPASAKANTRQILLASLFFGLTLLTHLAYTVFLALSLLVLALGWSSARKRGILTAAAVFLGGIVIASPWWITVVLRYGPGIFFHALGTHQSDFLASAIQSPTGIIDVLMGGWVALGPWLSPAALTGFALVGVAYWFAQKKWTLLLWLFAIIYLMGESLRFQLILYSFAAADASIDFLRARFQAEPDSKWVLPRLVFITSLVAYFVLFSALTEIRKTSPALDADALAVAAWVKENTPREARYLYFDSTPDGLNEWLPYLTARVPAVGHWGHEWIDDYQRQHDAVFSLASCAKDESWECAQNIIQQNEIRMDYLILPKDLPALSFQAAQKPAIQKVYENARFSVFETIP
jgi:hypothetical protein